MARIYEKDKAYFEKQDNETIATEIRVAKERMLKSLRSIIRMISISIYWLRLMRGCAFL